jgi:protein TonB
MSYLKTKEQKKSAAISVLLVVLLILLFRFVSIINVIEAPEDSGIAINFGNTAVGSGPAEPAKTTKVAPQSNPEQVNQPETSQVENVVTQENTEAPSVVSDPTVKPTKPAAKPVKPKPDPKPDSSVLDALNSVTGSESVDGQVNTGEGPGDGPGNKGDINGDPYANTYYGAPGSGQGGKGYGLKGRGKVAGRGILPTCDETGKVIVEIEVDRAGKVKKATPGKKGTTNRAACLLIAAEKSAMTYRFSAAPQAKETQIGFIEVIFKLGE